jgi:hypothetical protein
LLTLSFVPCFLPSFPFLSSFLRNFGSDLKDSKAYFLLLSQLGGCEAINEDDSMEERARKVIANAKLLGVAPFLTAKDILDGNKKLNLGFIAQIFSTKSGLVEEKDEEVEPEPEPEPEPGKHIFLLPSFLLEVSSTKSSGLISNFLTLFISHSHFLFSTIQNQSQRKLLLNTITARELPWRSISILCLLMILI